MSFDASGAPTVKNLFDGLTEKFGQPSWTQGIPWAAWVWDKTGQLSKKYDNGCGHSLDIMIVASGRASAFDWWAKSDVIQSLQADLGRNCAIVVKVQMGANDANGVVGFLKAELVGVQPALQTAVAGDNHVKQVQQAKREEAVKKAGANKPAL